MVEAKGQKRDRGLIELTGMARHVAADRPIPEFSLSIHGGETTVLHGSAGSGKSALVRLILGLDRATRGRVRFGKEELTPCVAPRLRRRIGYVARDGLLFPHRTVHENLVLVARSHGRDAATAATRLDEVLPFVAMSADDLDRRPRDLDGVGRLRASLARALLLDPPILILEEPLASIPADQRYAVAAELRNLFAELKRAVLLTTADAMEAELLGGRSVALPRGRIELAPAPADLPTLVARLLRVPPDLHELAVALGMPSRTILWRVDIPLAFSRGGNR